MSAFWSQIFPEPEAEPPSPDAAAERWARQETLDKQHQALHELQMGHAERLSDRTSVVNAILLAVLFWGTLFAALGAIWIVERL